MFNFARSPESLPSAVRVPARVAALLFIVALIIPLRGVAAEDRRLPDHLDAAKFWEIVSTFSEAGGSFPSHNFVSNETAFQTVIPRLTQRVKPGGVYIGVGPDQNFTYIAALQPSIAFIVDIRRQNLLHQLLYKALFELSPTRADFVAMLFSRPRPPDFPATAPAGTLFALYHAIDPSPEMYQRNLRQIVDRLTKHHGFPLTPDDLVNLEFVYQMFMTHGPAINYSPPPASIRTRYGELLQSPFPSFADLMTGADQEGLQHAYLANETRYRRVRDMQLRNVIIPVVGDFAGPKALRAIGDYVRSHKATATALYTSNVEQYLFQNDVWREYYMNVASLPLDSTSTFIRSFFPSAAPGGQIFVPTTDPRPSGLTAGQREPSNRFVASESLLCPVQDLLSAVADGRVTRYLAVIGLSK